eukprot:c6649_g1_i1.p2 GENE.c6649_g1_i1~~c6649_g1_i1.p2  ORF type:complete len:119 (+),score=22.04 c6649_g1_i1:76-432(+)
MGNVCGRSSDFHTQDTMEIQINPRLQPHNSEQSRRTSICKPSQSFLASLSLRFFAPVTAIPIRKQRKVRFKSPICDIAFCKPFSTNNLVQAISPDLQGDDATSNQFVAPTTDTSPLRT